MRKKYKTAVITASIVLGSITLHAQDNPLWMRYPAISPDGKSIAFCYKGDIFKVSSKGGVAVQLTSNPAYDYMPVWSPDSKSIAFASNRYGNFDIFLIQAEGGRTPKVNLPLGQRGSIILLSRWAECNLFRIHPG